MDIIRLISALIGMEHQDSLYLVEILLSSRTGGELVLVLAHGGHSMFYFSIQTGSPMR